jgi:hypothetical protein
MCLSKLKSQCADRQKIIVCKENGKKYTANNIDMQLVRKLRLLEIINQMQCDYVVLNDEKKTAYFIELKGHHVEEAIKQVFASKQRYLQELTGYTINLRIVASRVTLGFQNQPALKKFYAQNGIIKTMHYTEDI